MDFDAFGPAPEPAPEFDDPLRERLYHNAQLCVLCGFCIPHCPTYALALDEAESPRGRITLMKALATGEIDSGDDKAAGHLERCLGCRACEFVCPSRVPYGAMFDDLHTLFERERPHSALVGRLRNHAFALVADNQRLRRSLGLLRLYQKSPLQWLARNSGVLRLTGLAAMEADLPPLPSAPQWQPSYPPSGTPQRGEVALFTGCLGSYLDREALLSSIRVLTRLGYTVHVAKEQQCCGALHQHNGDPETALALARRNLDAFAALPEGVGAVLHVASGCGAQLVEYDRLAWPDEAERSRASAFAAQVRDINRFLIESEGLDELRLRPLEKRVAIHDPCSQTWVLRGPHFPHQLLRRIPGLQLTPLPDNARCCGAAGSYLVTQPEMAKRLRAPKLDAVAELAPELLATTNTGCAMHLANGLRERGIEVEVVHPVSLLARQLEEQEP